MKDHDIRNECTNSSEEEFEHRNVWLRDTGASAHMTMVHSGFKSMVKRKVKTWMGMQWRLNNLENGEGDTM